MPIESEEGRWIIFQEEAHLADPLAMYSIEALIKHFRGDAWSKAIVP